MDHHRLEDEAGKPTDEVDTQPLHTYLAQTLPANAAQPHTLVLGAYRDEPDCANYLISPVHLNASGERLSQLKSTHNLATIGVDYPPYMNVFFWAYKDGKLDEICGDHEGAQYYIHAILRAYTDPHERDIAAVQAELILKALDHGIDVVAHNTRMQLGEALKQESNGCESLQRFVAETADQTNLSPDDIRSDWRQDALNLPHQITAGSRHKAWMIDEVGHLLAQYPHYADRLDPMRKLIDAGRIHTLPADQISALLFDAAASPNGNRIAICDPTHMDGYGSDIPGHSDGGFAHYLGALKPNDLGASLVSRAVIGDLGTHHRFDAHYITNANNMGGDATDLSPLSLIDSHMHRVDTIAPPTAIDPPTRNFANPLLLPAIRNNVQQIQDALHPDRPKS